MQVSIKKFDVGMEIKTKGIELEVHDNDDNHLGDLVITKTRLIWCTGQTTRRRGIRITWAKFIKLMED